MDVNDLIFENDLERPNEVPLMARERFTPSEQNKLFLKECREKGYDISTIINLALNTFAPKTKSNYYTWEGVNSVINGKKKWL